jgi:hypothetical protein
MPSEGNRGKRRPLSLSGEPRIRVRVLQGKERLLEPEQLAFQALASRGLE